MGEREREGRKGKERRRKRTERKKRQRERRKDENEGERTSYILVLCPKITKLKSLLIKPPDSYCVFQ